VANLGLARAAPTAANVTVKAPRDYLTEREVERLMDVARENRCGHRDATAILLAYRHGLRASELVGLRWDDIDWQTSTLHVRRSKAGIGTRQPLRGAILAEVTVLATGQLLGEAPQRAVHNPPVAAKAPSVKNVDLRSAHERPLEARVLRRYARDEPETRR
jgi:integrase